MYSYVFVDAGVGNALIERNKVVLLVSSKSMCNVRAIVIQFVNNISKRALHNSEPQYRRLALPKFFFLSQRDALFS